MSFENFRDALRYERNQQPRADEFYKSLGYAVLSRPDYNTKEGKELQKRGIDVILGKSNDVFDIDSQQFTVSEKFRSRNYDDVLIEIWDRLDDKLENSHIPICDADKLFYFCGHKEVIEIDAQALDLWTDTLRRWCLDHIIPEDIERMKNWGSMVAQVNGPLGETIRIELKSFKTEINANKHWYNICALIKKRDLDEFIDATHEIEA